MSASTQYPSLPFATVESSLPRFEVAESDLLINHDEASGLRTLVVLDDDPTGTQTVRDVVVLTTFEKSAMKLQLRKRDPGFFILTNSRAFHHEEAKSLLQRLLTDLHDAASEEGVDIEVVTRSDSCLRGHFPLEPDLVHDIMGPVNAIILCPAFFEGGRITVNDVHYAREKEMLVPVGNTPFALDKAFGFRSSNLHEWVLEKFRQGNDRTPRLASISLGDLRKSDAVSSIGTKLESLLSSTEAEDTHPLVIILNAFNHDDLRTFVAARARAKGLKFVYRSGASLVSAYLGIMASVPLSPEEILNLSDVNGRGGLIVVGSYVPKTTAQLHYLLQRCRETSKHIELEISDILTSSSQRESLARDTAYLADSTIVAGKDIIISTSRTLVTNDDPKHSLSMGKIISDLLCEIVRSIEKRPRYIIAKGGITSSDIATSGLGIKAATVIGQAAPGIPVWRSGTESSKKWPDIPYVVFPGNTGEDTTLGELVWSLRSGQNLNTDT